VPPAEAILAAPSARSSEGEEIGRSREGRSIRAFKLGRGTKRLSLLAGCHADEPVGPRLLRRLVGFLGRLPAEDPLLTELEWWVIPHINPDGARRNLSWQRAGVDHYELPAYLAGVVRELPGDDIEFGFPSEPGDPEARPENRAALRWWKNADGPFAMHASLHGMGFGAGPWFLIEPAWSERCEGLMARCAQATERLGYGLHDVERGGEKGFFRIARGFCTRPDSRYMRKHFLDLGDEATAGRFRPSSMETVRALGGDPLTLVSEMPLFITPGVGEVLGPPDPAAIAWRERLEMWRERLGPGASGDDRHEGEAEMRAVEAEAGKAGLRAMSVPDQMRLQWSFICAGLEQVEHELS
jgi:hypothetical protein